MARPEKVQSVENLRGQLAKAGSVIFTDFRGLHVGELASLRRKLRDVGVDYKVVKNTLFVRAAESLALERVTPFLEGPTGVVFCGTDPVAPAKVLLDYIRQMKKLEIRGGLIEGQVFSSDQMRRIAELPPKAALLTQAVGLLVAPPTRLVRVLTALQRNLVYALDQVRKAREVAAA